MNEREIEQKARETVGAAYHRIFWREDGGAYGGMVLELPGVFAGGDSIEEANDDLEAAMEAWIEHELNAGRDIPRPLDFEGFSGRLTFRIPPTLHHRAYVRAQLEGISLNRLLSTAVAAYLGDVPYTSPAPAPGTAAERAAELALREEEGEFGVEERET